MKVYISGKMTGLTKKHYSENFSKAERLLTSKGCEVVNPCAIDGLPFSREEYLKIDLLLIYFCDAIYMLKNWEDSEGAKKELEEAKDLGLEIMYEGEEIYGVSNT